MNPLEQLRDIKPLVEVPDYSLYVLVVLIVAGVICVGLFIHFILRFWKARQANPVKRAKIALEALTFEDAKKSAYRVSELAPLLADSEEKQQACVLLIEAMQKYKYKREVPSFLAEDKQQLLEYLKACR